MLPVSQMIESEGNLETISWMRSVFKDAELGHAPKMANGPVNLSKFYTQTW